MRNTPKHPDSNRTRLDLTLTCQVLADGLSIHSLTRKTSYCQGTKRYKGARERERKKMEVKVNQISSFQLTKLKNWKLLTRDCFEATDYFYWVKPAGHPAEVGKNCLSSSDFPKTYSIHQEVNSLYPSMDMWSMVLKEMLKKTKFRTANLHVTKPTAMCYLFVSPGEWNPLERSRQRKCC